MAKRPPRLLKPRAREARRRGTKRATGNRFYAIKGAQLQRAPLCAECLRLGGYEVAAVADHVIPLAEGGAEGDPLNLQSLCKVHHDAKTAEEGRRGARRARVE